MTKLRYPFGGGCVRQPCAVCTGAAYERSTEPLERLPILGGRHTHNDEQDCTGTALAGDDMGADNRLYAESGGRYAPSGEYRRRVGNHTDGGADGYASAHTTAAGGERRLGELRNRFNRNAGQNRGCAIPKCNLELWQQRSDSDHRGWRQPAHAHREQVYRLLYVPSHRLMLSKGVAV